MAWLLFAGLAVRIALVSSYWFYPQDEMKGVFLAVMSGTMVTWVWVLVQMNRDEVLSRMQGSTPGRIIWDRTFLTQLVVPLLLLVLAALARCFGRRRSSLGPGSGR